MTPYTLAKEIVDEWDMDNLLLYAIEKLEEYYKNNPEAFAKEVAEREEWKRIKN